MVAFAAALFGCGAAPVIADLPVAGVELTRPAPAAQAALDAHMARFAERRFTVGAARYARPQDGLGWQPLLSRVATEPRVQRGAVRLVEPSDQPEAWQVELFRTRGRDGFAVAMLAPAGGGDRLLGYYAVTYLPGYKPAVRDANRPG